MTIVNLDAVDAEELAEILEYFMRRLEIIAEHGLSALVFEQCGHYDIDDLRADATRLIQTLRTTKLSP
jgi:hypothetical protein